MENGDYLPFAVTYARFPAAYVCMLYNEHVICFRFNELNKRVLETNCKIKRGDIVSVERALILTDKPNTTAEKFSVYRCHHCLRVISYFVT